MENKAPSYIAFAGSTRIAAGSLRDVALRVKQESDAAPLTRILVFNATSSDLIDFDLRGTEEDVLGRLALIEQLESPPEAEPPPVEPSAPAGPGRPKLGVIAREVTLLPRHWDWLKSQPGGASVALRKLVEQAKRASVMADRLRQAQNAAFNFMSAMGGNLENFEEATRALFAADRVRFEALIAPWPADIADHLRLLSALVFQTAEAAREAPMDPAS